MYIINTKVNKSHCLTRIASFMAVDRPSPVLNVKQIPESFVKNTPASSVIDLQVPMN